MSSEPIDDHWIVIFTRGGTSYYHNKTTKETSWTLPEELNTPAPANEIAEPTTQNLDGKDESSHEDSESGNGIKRALDQEPNEGYGM